MENMFNFPSNMGNANENNKIEFLHIQIGKICTLTVPCQKTLRKWQSYAMPRVGRGGELEQPLWRERRTPTAAYLGELLRLCLLPVTISVQTVSAHSTIKKPSFFSCECRHHSHHGRLTETPIENIMSH